MAAGAAETANPAIHHGEAVAETMEEKARRLVREFLGKRKMRVEELKPGRLAGLFIEQDGS